MKTLPLAILLAVAVFGGGLRAQVHETFATESFEYAPGPLGFVNPPDGGFGWADKWYSGLSGYSFFVATPGLDATGNRAMTNIADDGAYRRVNTAAVGTLADANGEIGVNGTALWVDFMIQRETISNDEYGGLSLHIWLAGESLFLGCPYQANEWGFVSPGGTPTTVTGSNLFVPTRLVYRIDFQTGDERVRMWIDPVADFPDPAITPPDLDGTATDFTFNEIRIQSGSTIDQTGYSFDAVKLSADAWRPVLAINNAVAGSVAQVSLLNLTPNALATIGYSMTGAGPTNTPLGPASLSPPIQQIPVTANANGEVLLNYPLPQSLSGRTIYTHAAETSPSPALSNPVVVHVQ